MGMFNKLTSRGKQLAGNYLRQQLAEHQGNRTPQTEGGGTGPARSEPAAPTGDANEAAIAKYKYMLRTAPPEDMERAHAEAFARLSPEQRGLLQAELDDQLPTQEQPHSARPDDLARSATRAEVKSPGFMEKILGGTAAGGSRAGAATQEPRRGKAGLGGFAGAAGGLGAGLFAGVAGGFIGSAIAGPLLEGFSGIGGGLGEATEGLGDMASGLEGSMTGLGDAASGLGDTASTAGEEALSEGGGLLGGLFNAGEEFLGGGGDGFFGDGGGKF